MPYFICEKSKQKMRLNAEVCFNNQCPYYKQDILGRNHCNFKPASEKRVEKRRGKKK